MRKFEITDQPARPIYAFLVIVIALLLPSIVTWIYFVALAESPASIQYGASSIGKAIQFALPVVWVFLICRRKPNWQWPGGRDLLVGAASGLAIAAAMSALYFGWLRNDDLFAIAIEPVRVKVAGLGIDTLGKYLALTVFYALVHSLLEEYYWRWFVFAELRKLTSISIALTVSAVGFAAHHVIVLAKYFGYGSPLTWLFTLGVAIGGVIWAYQFERTKSLWGIWLSHLLVDATIFLIGLHLIGRAFQ